MVYYASAGDEACFAGTGNGHSAEFMAFEKEEGGGRREKGGVKVCAARMNRKWDWRPNHR